MGSCYIREADQFFITPDGEYCFDKSLLREAHQWTQGRVENDLINGTGCVIVSNTLCSTWECQRYLELAEQYEYKLQIIRTPKPWVLDSLYNLNVHKVPRETIRNQIERYKPLPGEQEWNE